MTTKSVSKQVVEIIEPQHEYIERVLVVLRPDCPNVRVATRRAEAEKYVAGLVCWKRRLWPAGQTATRNLLTWAGIVAGAVAVVGLLWLMW